MDTTGGIGKTHICRDLKNLPLVGRGVSSTTQYTGLSGGNKGETTITKVVFNDCEKENEEKLINIPGTEAYIMVKLNRAGAGSNSSEDKTEVVENKVFMKKQVIVDGSKPIRFYTTYESFKVHDNNITGPSVSKELLKSGMPTTDAKRIAKAYSKMGVEAYSVKNGVLQSMSVKVAGKKRGGHKDIALSDVAKDVTVDQVAKISNLYEDHFATADEDGNYTKMTPKEKANLKSKIQELEENVSRGFRGQGVRIKSFQELSQGLYGQPLAEVSARGPAGKSPKNAINALKKNFDTNLAIDMKRLFADTPQDNPIALEFLRQVAQYAVIRANSINEMTSIGGDQRRRLFTEVFDLSSSTLNKNAINIPPNHLEDILMELSKGFQDLITNMSNGVN